MLAYELYTFNKKKGYEFIGVLPERRKNPMRITKNSMMNWGKSLLGQNVDGKNMFFKRVAIDSLLGRILWVGPSSNDNRVVQDRRLHPTSFISALKSGGRRKGFRRKGEGQNRYVDCPSLRTIVLTLMIVALSTLDAIFTFFHLENGASELNPLMGQIIQTGFQSFVIIKSLGVGLIGWSLAIHQNFKISFYGMHVSAAIYMVLLAYHLACS
jgi:hypothetical protein